MSRMQEKIIQPLQPVYAGVDVGKHKLDFFVSNPGKRLQVNNDDEGMQALVRACQDHRVGLVALEATGKYHSRLHDRLHESDIPVAVINPFRARQFADSIGQLAKTDTIDAELLARFAERMSPEPSTPPCGPTRALRELHTARRQVVDELGDLKRRLQTTDHPLAADQIQERIAMAMRHKAALEKEIQTRIDGDPAMKRNSRSSRPFRESAGSQPQSSLPTSPNSAGSTPGRSRRWLGSRR